MKKILFLAGMAIPVIAIVVAGLFGADTRSSLSLSLTVTLWVLFFTTVAVAAVELKTSLHPDSRGYWRRSMWVTLLLTAAGILVYGAFNFPPWSNWYPFFGTVFLYVVVIRYARVAIRATQVARAWQAQEAAQTQQDADEARSHDELDRITDLLRELGLHPLVYFKHHVRIEGAGNKLAVEKAYFISPEGRRPVTDRMALQRYREHLEYLRDARPIMARYQDQIQRYGTGKMVGDERDAFEAMFFFNKPLEADANAALKMRAATDLKGETPPHLQ